ncbi:hypothetical protein ANCCAN_23705, partial [Ancylostoma caninum]
LQLKPSYSKQIDYRLVSAYKAEQLVSASQSIFSFRRHAPIQRCGFAALCFLYIASSAEELPKCEQLGKEGLKEDERKSVVDQINKALKKAASTVYSCPLENGAKMFAYMPDYMNFYDMIVFRHEEDGIRAYDSLVQNAIKEWSSDLETLTGPQMFGCNYGELNGKTTLACLVGPKL